MGDIIHKHVLGLAIAICLACPVIAEQAVALFSLDTESAPLVELALAELSDEPDMTLLERAEMAKIQKELSLSRFEDGFTPLPSLMQNVGLFIVVKEKVMQAFDGTTGVRLLDVPVDSADGLAESVRQAAKKQRDFKGETLHKISCLPTVFANLSAEQRMRARKLDELMNRALSNYLKGMLTNEEVIEELLRIAEDIKREEEEGNELGLTTEEKAFYDALTSPEGIRQAYTDEQFVALTKELTEELRKNRTIDWNRKESSRAKMRVMVKRLLKKYHYPPEGQEQALRTVMEQCDKWADDEENLESSRLYNVEDDREVRNLIYERLLLNPDTDDLELQREVMEVFGERYPGMRIIDWRKIIIDYTPLVREAAKKPTAKVIEMQHNPYRMAAEPEEE